jgi:hypothetical protein
VIEVDAARERAYVSYRQAAAAYRHCAGDYWPTLHLVEHPSRGEPYAYVQLDRDELEALEARWLTLSEAIEEASV